jgi:hypothetical protein
VTSAVVILACLACAVACAAVVLLIHRADARNAAVHMARRADWLGLVNPPVPHRRRSHDVGLVRPAPDAPRVLNDF